LQEVSKQLSGTPSELRNTEIEFKLNSATWIYASI